MRSKCFGVQLETSATSASGVRRPHATCACVHSVRVFEQEDFGSRRRRWPARRTSSRPVPSARGDSAVGRSASLQPSRLAERRAQRRLAAIHARLQRLERRLEVPRHAVQVAGHALQDAGLRDQRIESAHAGLDRMEEAVDLRIRLASVGDAAARRHAVEQRLRRRLGALFEIGIDVDAAARRAALLGQHLLGDQILAVIPAEQLGEFARPER